jgi:hypothetical protein
MSEGLWLGFKKLNEKDLKKILLKLSCTTRRDRRPRKCRRLEGLAEILNKLPPAKPPAFFNVVGNSNIGDADMKDLHLIPDSVSSFDFADCGLTPAGVQTLCDYMKHNTRIVPLSCGAMILAIKVPSTLQRCSRKTKLCKYCTPVIHPSVWKVTVKSRRPCVKTTHSAKSISAVAVMKLAILMSRRFVYLVFCSTKVSKRLI